ncbi:hypothetical protein D9757_013834 [Collybiopsis confluens]|uniref:Uncharacterized protein n=1 Tax=Collybiopsis confluens TaxID=2823264 RepID=A0A8H5LMP1_9AGAR|nr:hypothetical protein D9757_013834 [Collybiopsis confluens]
MQARSLCVNIADVIKEDVDPSGQTHSLPSDTASVWMSLGVNILATSLVAVKMIQHRMTVKGLKSSYKRKRTSVERLLLFFVESGSFFCGLQLLFAIFDTLNLDETSTTDSYVQITALILYSLFNGLTVCRSHRRDRVGCELKRYLSSVLYPISVIIMVNLDRSVIEESVHRPHIAADTNQIL